MGTLASGQVELYAEEVGQLRKTNPDLADAIADFTGIAQVVDWLGARGAGNLKIDMIGMDEFEYDFLIEVDPEGRWLVFGVT